MCVGKYYAHVGRHGVSEELSSYNCVCQIHGLKRGIEKGDMKNWAKIMKN